MNGFDFFQLSLLDQVLIVCSVVCTTATFAILICVARRNCFFFRWYAETRLLALMAAPMLLILWPLLLYAWFLRSRGIDPADPDLFNDD